MRIAPKLTADHIRKEAERRILSRYPLWKQMNIMRAGGADAEAMAAFIDGIRSASNRLESDIPADFKNDRHWP